MNTVGNIIEAVRNGQRPDYEELRYTVCALSALLTFDRGAFMKLAEAQVQNKKPVLVYSAQWQWQEHFGRVQRAMAQDPKVWVGWNNDPDNPEFLERRKLALKVLDRATKES